MKKMIVVFSVLAVSLLTPKNLLLAQTKDSVNQNYPSGIISMGYSSHTKFIFRYESISPKQIFPFGKTYVYLDFGFRRPKFVYDSIMLNGVVYSSSARLIVSSTGIAHEFGLKRFRIMPFAGLRIAQATFTNEELHNGIENSLFGVKRYWNPGNNRPLIPVGPLIRKQYGYAFSPEFGLRLNYILTDKWQITGLFGYTKLQFDTEDSLFGPYMGEEPYKNPYYIRIPRMRYELCISYRL